ncbi:MAG: hypothetical protein ACYCX2_11405 [Christensenellales bacterium]
MQLPLLVVLYAGVSGVVTLNNQIAGEITPKSARISLPLPPQGNVYLGFFPFESEKLPFIRRLWADGEGLKLEPDPCLLVTSWPGGVYSAEPLPMSIARREAACVPWVLARCSQDSLTATLYRENEHYLVIEDREEDQMVFFYGLKYDPGDCEMAFINDKGGLYLALNGTQSAVLVNVMESKVIFEQRASSISWDQDDIISLTKLNDLVCHEARTAPCHTQEGDQPQYGFFSGEPLWPQAKEDTAIAFFEAMHLGLYGEARNYLSKELADNMDDDTLREFFNGHTQWTKSLFHMQRELCLGGIDFTTRQVKLFSFEIIQEESEQGPYKINNIKEE